MKKLVLLTAASGLMLSSALAQSPSAPSSNAPAATPSPTTQSTSTRPTVGSADFIAAQTADQWLASKFKGTDVLGPDDKKVGDISDVLFQRDGKVLGYVVTVGGFLGMGAKDVALAPTAFQLQPGQDANDYKLKISMTQEQLKDAPAFEPYKAPVAAPTTGMNPTRSERVGTPTRPSGSAQ